MKAIVDYKLICFLNLSKKMIISQQNTTNAE